MGCQYHAPTEHGSTSYTVAMPKLTFGRGCLDEVGPRAQALGMTQVALYTDPGLESGPLVAKVQESLTQAGLQYTVFSDVRIEPCDDTVERAAQFLRSGAFDGVISVGGGSVIDTAKAALALNPLGEAPELSRQRSIIDHFAPPVGAGKPISGPVLPHIACPTTSGTGSECTSISVIRVNALNTKFVVANPVLLPVEALVDPQCCDSLPSNVVASTGFDLCCHALECFTARAYTHFPPIADVKARQLIQGSNPFSELGAREALNIVGEYLVRGVNDASDQQARDRLMWGATLAGIAFGNSGTHLPHAMSYGVTHLMNNITTDGYNVASPFVPHGISVVVSAPSIFRYTAEATPERHLQGAAHLLADAKGATPDEAGEVLAKRLVELMKGTHMPNGLNELGFTAEHVSDLAASSVRQQRAIANAPRESNQVDLENMYSAALSYW